MKVKALVAFRSKLFRPCRKLLLLFRFKLKRPLFIRPLRHCNRAHKSPPQDRKYNRLFSVFHSIKRSRKMDRLSELRSVVSEMEGGASKHFPSPLTPAYIRAAKREPFVDGDVEDACRSFEKYLVEMMVEEGTVKDLTDVEELLYCWKNLKCPVFIDLVSRFYGELCKDLFSPEGDDDMDTDRTR